MKDILQEIVAWKRVEVEAMKKAMPERDIHTAVEDLIASGSEVPSMSQALRDSETGIIAERRVGDKHPDRREIFWWQG